MVLQVQTITLIDALAIILSIVSLIITAVGFFASLKFYRDGVELQAKANDALTKLEERTHFIQAQVSGMFDKTLDAAIGKREALAGTFKELTEQLESAKSRIIEESLSQIDAAG
jgi:peptidoglycan hydrolase CwlO-like protein